MTEPPPSTFPRVRSGNLTSDLDITAEELRQLLDLAERVKRHPERYRLALRGRILSLLFEKPSLRTRMTFEVAAKQLGGDAILNTGPVGGREPVEDVARNLERWTDLIVARTFSQETVDALARHARIPVVNALSDLYHPCQALADMQTLREQWGVWRGHKLAFVGDGNNVAHSLMLDAARLGLDFTCITPPGYEPKPEIVAKAREFAVETGALIEVTNDLDEGLRGAGAVYTDVWASMGFEHEAAERARVFAAYQVNRELMAKALPGAYF
ncbi:MAG: ornithine carbamoyltransferase, partial [Bryobacteraceae bacterium]|nr:ornithine carbamoyltransferase [Bryobacteraceae bacterium]